jgi:hypothetical protein
VVQISAAIIFLSGIFAGGWNISTGIRNQKKKKSAADTNGTGTQA